MFYRIFIFFGSLWAFSACSPMQFSYHSTESLQALESFSTLGDNEFESGEELLTEDNEHVDYWIDYYSRGEGRSHMARYLERSTLYLPTLKQVFREKGLPEDLVYVALIESGFNPIAASTKEAVGLWQFIESTGKNYNLRINKHVDERRNVYLSTVAAAKYLTDLYSLFASWPLVLAAYNAGEGRISNAMLQSYNRDFWYLKEKNRIPKETSHFIPKIIAGTRIAKHPEKYGFHDLEYKESVAYDKLKLNKPMYLETISSHLNISLDELKELNPMYRSGYIPIYKDEGVAYVYIPKNIL